jgi:hypothetical protein
MSTCTSLFVPLKAAGSQDIALFVAQASQRSSANLIQTSRTRVVLGSNRTIAPPVDSFFLIRQPLLSTPVPTRDRRPTSDSLRISP